MRKDRSFWEYPIDKNGPNGCWIWLGPLWPDGYGQFGNSGRANRESYRIHKGDLPPGMLACHTCDNPPCVNPEHLYAGTNSQNIKEAFDKGRKRVDNHGQKNSRALLTAAEVLDIRRRWYLRNLVPARQAALAREYGVDPRTVNAIVLRDNWECLDEVRGLA